MFLIRSALLHLKFQKMTYDVTTPMINPALMRFSYLKFYRISWTLTFSRFQYLHVVQFIITNLIYSQMTVYLCNRMPKQYPVLLCNMTKLLCEIVLNQQCPKFTFSRLYHQLLIFLLYNRYLVLIIMEIFTNCCDMILTNLIFRES